jgi:hypothetical protein
LAESNPAAAADIPALRQDLGHQVSVHVGQPEFPALEAVGQLLVVHPEAVQQRRVEIVDVDLILHGVVAEVVSRAVCEYLPGRPRSQETKRKICQWNLTAIL